jgi:predicted nucleic acid-binding protein
MIIAAGRGILDTSTVLLLGRLTDPAVLPARPVITAVTIAELSVGPLLADTEQERAARQAHLQQADADFDPVVFDAAAAHAFGRIVGSLRSSGGRAAPSTNNVFIAATAIANDLPLYTCNPGDFEGINDLDLHVVPHPDHDQPTPDEARISQTK